MAEAEKSVPTKRFSLDHFIGGRGRLIAGWILVHEAETALALLLPIDILRPRLKRLIGELLYSEDRRLNALGADLKKQVAEVEKGADSIDFLRGMLHEGLGACARLTERVWTEKINLYNQAFWIITIGMIFSMYLAGLGNAIYLFLGGLGGFVSRLTRAIEPQGEKALQSGVYWTTLFLSPLLGALAGWTGMLVIAGLSHHLGYPPNPGQTIIFWPKAAAPPTSADTVVPVVGAWAFLLGFSERSFTGVISSLRVPLVREREPKKPPTTE